jgi:hypothetical protein
MQTFNATDTILQDVTTWPNNRWEGYFETKLKFQIQHSIFRTKVHEIVSGCTAVSLHSNSDIFVIDSRG